MDIWLLRLMKLTAKLTIVIVLGSIFSIAFLSFLTFFLTRNALQDATAKQQLELAKQTMDKIDRLLFERYNGIKIIASDVTVVDYIKSNPVVSSLTPSQSDIPLALKRTIEQLILSTGPWDNIDIVNTKGQAIYSTNEVSIGQDLETDPEITTSLQNGLRGSITYSDVFLNRKTHKPTIVFIAPIHDELDPARQIVGAAIGQLSWPVVLEILQDTNAYSINLFNTKGDKIGDGNPDNNGQILQHTTQNIVSSTFVNQSRIIVNPESKASFLTSYIKEQGFLDYLGNGWILTIETPIAIAFSEAVNTAALIALGLLPIIAIGNGLSLLFVLQSLRPLRRIGQTAHEIAAGDLTKRVPVGPMDEIGKLATSFNEMADKLQEVYAGLEKKVTEKTAELAKKIEETEKINTYMIGREMKMVELKKEIEDLKEKTQPPPVPESQPT